MAPPEERPSGTPAKAAQPWNYFLLILNSYGIQSFFLAFQILGHHKKDPIPLLQTQLIFLKKK
jgi:hypothetical protein